MDEVVKFWSSQLTDFSSVSIEISKRAFINISQIYIEKKGYPQKMYSQLHFFVVYFCWRVYHNLWLAVFHHRKPRIKTQYLFLSQLQKITPNHVENELLYLLANLEKTDAVGNAKHPKEAVVITKKFKECLKGKLKDNKNCC